MLFISARKDIHAVVLPELTRVGVAEGELITQPLRSSPAHRYSRALCIAFFCLAIPLEGRGQTLKQTCAGFDFGHDLTKAYLVQHDGKKAEVTIPVSYLLHPETFSSGSPGGSGTGIFSYDRDTLQPYPRRKMRGKIAKGMQTWIRLLISRRHDMDISVKRYIADNAGHSIFSNVNFPEARLRNGLNKVEFEPVIRGRYVFLVRSNDKILDFIGCNRDGDVPFPQCEHYSQFEGFDVQLSYPKEQLGHWKQIKQNARNFLKCVKK